MDPLALEKIAFSAPATLRSVLMHPDRSAGWVATAVRSVAQAAPRRHVIRVFLMALTVLLSTFALFGTATTASADETPAATPRAAPSGSAANRAAPGQGVPGANSPDAAAPLTAADRDLLVKVRLAGLWEQPAGRMAMQLGVNPRVREIGAMISQQHSQLDALVVAAARQLGVPLPNEPNSDQRGWLNEMRTATGAQFDHVFVDRLRAAHGKVFPAIANVRSGTRNSVVRELAQSANGFVLNHLTLLESTGLVDYAKLPTPPAPSPTATPAPARISFAGAVTSAVDSPFWFLWVVVPVAVGMIAWRVLRASRRRDPDDDEPVTRRPSRRDAEPPERPAPRWDEPPREPLRRDGWPPPRPPDRSPVVLEPHRERLPSPYGYGRDPAPLHDDRRLGAAPPSFRP